MLKDGVALFFFMWSGITELHPIKKYLTTPGIGSKHTNA